MDRKKEQVDLIFKLGLVLSPLYDVITNPENHTAHTRSRAGAKFFHDLPKVKEEFFKFTRSEPGHKYEREYTRFVLLFNALGSGVERCLDDSADLLKLLDEKYTAIREAVFSIPVSADADILEPYTPFRSYCVIKDLIHSASQNLTLVDRYMDATLFYRYFQDLHLNTACMLVTQPQSNYKSPAKWTELMDISRLYAAERGPNCYSFVVNPNFHDRWLCIDDQIYSLGGSINHAGMKNSFTITQVTPSPENRQKVDDLVTNGTELFGPNQPVHP